VQLETGRRISNKGISFNIEMKSNDNSSSPTAKDKKTSSRNILYRRVHEICSQEFEEKRMQVEDLRKRRVVRNTVDSQTSVPPKGGQLKTEPRVGKTTEKRYSLNIEKIQVGKSQLLQKAEPNSRRALQQ